MPGAVALPAVPFPLTPLGDPAVWQVQPDGTVVADAPPGSDLYVDPAREAGGEPDGAGATLPQAPALLGLPPEGPFRLSARVHVDFRSQFDAGVLLVWADERTWAKLCLERSPAGRAMVVSVVTRGVSDDANAFVVDGDTWLRVSRTDGVYALHASVDGSHWELVRVFGLGRDVERHRVGLEAQSPTGDGCRVTFHDVRFDRERLTDLRDGS